MKFVAITVGHLLAVDRSKLDKQSTIDEVVLKNLEAHESGMPGTVLNVSESVANRIIELAGEDPAKLEADRVAAEQKAAAEKAEAERVAAEQKAAAEKAEADRVAAE